MPAPATLNITRIGRWSELSGSLYTPTTGHRLRFQFTGSNLSITVSNALAVNLAIDGVLQGRRGPGTIAYTSLSNFAHTAELWVESCNYGASRWSATTGGCIVSDITAAGISPWPTGQPRLLVLGDSISEGLRVLGNDHDGRRAYHQQAAEQLGLEVWPWAFGGTGILKDWSPYIPNALDAWPYARDGIAKVEESCGYCLIAHAANDIGLSNASFEADYAALLALIRADHPGIKIFICTPIAGYADDKVQPVKNVVTADGQAVLVDTRLWPTIARSTDGAHPSLAGHTTMAAALVPILSQYLVVGPTLTVNPVASPTTIGTQTITGTATGESIAVTVNGQPVAVVAGAWSYDAVLVPGINTITAQITSPAGEDTIVVSIDYQLVVVPVDLPDLLFGDGSNWQEGDLFAGDGDAWQPVVISVGNGAGWQ